MNEPLDGVRQVHFVGIGGIGMSALARYLLSRGYRVTGSDRSPGAQGEVLRELGATVYSGHAAQNIGGADLVVVTSAAAEDNPEVVAAAEGGVPVMKRAQLLAAIAASGRAIAVAGTHGKTTTSALIGHLLVEAGLDPTILIGGIMQNLKSNSRTGSDETGRSSQLVVVEADEYDASFLHLRPEIGVILNVEPEHLDFYVTPERMNQAFEDFALSVTDTLIVCADDPMASEVASSASARVLSYGTGNGDLRAHQVREENGFTRFSAGGRDWSTNLAGVHNVRNALAAIIVAQILGVPDETTASALLSFLGTARRFEVKGEAAGVIVMDDYAHHPTEVRTTLDAVASRYERPIRLVFQPHTYSRTKAFLGDFASAFGGATEVYLLDIYASRETDTLGITSQDLLRAAECLGVSVTYARSRDAAVHAVVADSEPGDVVLTMGAGDVGELGEAIVRGLEER